VEPLKEYVGCKINCDMINASIKITQPVLIQSFAEEFNLPGVKPIPKILAPHGDQLCKEDDMVFTDEQAIYWKGVGKLLHLMKYSRVDVLNHVRELSRFVSYPSKNHMDAMYWVMEYILNKKNCGLLLKPNTTWNSDKNFEFIVMGRSDSDYAKDKDTRRSVTGWSVFLCGAPVSTKSKMLQAVSLSVTEAELFAGCNCAQDMMFVMRILNSMGLKVKLPMVLQMENKGAINLVYNWSSAGRTRHICTKVNFLPELKESLHLIVKWIPRETNLTDMCTKNIGGAFFKEFVEVYCGKDDY
jgi:hypothetical protein